MQTACSLQTKEPYFTCKLKTTVSILQTQLHFWLSRLLLFLFKLLFLPCFSTWIPRHSVASAEPVKNANQQESLLVRMASVLFQPDFPLWIFPLLNNVSQISSATK